MTQITRSRQGLYSIVCQRTHRHHRIQCNQMHRWWWVECHHEDRLDSMQITILVNFIANFLFSQQKYRRFRHFVFQSIHLLNIPVCFDIYSGNYQMHRINFGPPPPPPPISTQSQRQRFTNRWSRCLSLVQHFCTEKKNNKKLSWTSVVEKAIRSTLDLIDIFFYWYWISLDLIRTGTLNEFHELFEVEPLQMSH